MLKGVKAISNILNGLYRITAPAPPPEASACSYPSTRLYGRSSWKPANGK